MVWTTTTRGDTPGEKGKDIRNNLDNKGSINIPLPPGCRECYTIANTRQIAHWPRWHVIQTYKWRQYPVPLCASRRQELMGSDNVDSLPLHHQTGQTWGYVNIVDSSKRFVHGFFPPLHSSLPPPEWLSLLKLLVAQKVEALVEDSLSTLCNLLDLKHPSLVYSVFKLEWCCARNSNWNVPGSSLELMSFNCTIWLFHRIQVHVTTPG